MHELALAENIFTIAQEELARHGCSKLNLLRLEIGALSGVVVDSLIFGFETLLQGTPHEGAKLEIIQIPLRLRCSNCANEFEGESGIGDLSPCPQCGEMLGHTVLTGKELRVCWIDGQ